ncbi:MAG: metal ABC transporter solute-binding protein, Zn/Mn family [Rectinema subterraneum]|uniref:metal ABC transporter solute-binding protein, Zn/Mn family n=1 Tax=Rectinema subterraneum TaxID=2653714 RepID=UPI003C79C407
MKRMLRSLFFILFALGLVGASFAQAKKPALKIAVSIPPMQEWVERIAGDRASITLVLPPGSSPHAFEPSPRQLAELGQADIWFTISVEFEYSLRPKVSAMFPKLSIVDVTKNVKFRTFRPGEQETGEPASAGQLNPALTNRDKHTWLGYEQAKAEITFIRDTLIAKDPEGTEVYKKNYDAYLKEIDEVYNSLRTKLAPLAGSKVFVYHPAFGYFLDMFNITQEAVELGGKEPTQKELTTLVELAKKEKAKAIFVQAQFSQSAAQAVANTVGAAVVPIDPLAADWLANLGRMGQALLNAGQRGK